MMLSGRPVKRGIEWDKGPAFIAPKSKDFGENCTPSKKKRAGT
jgi:hypothetical protein